MKVASITFNLNGWDSSGDLPFAVYSDAAKTTEYFGNNFDLSAAKEFYIFFTGECFRLAIPHVPQALEIEFFDHLGVSKGCLRDLWANDSGVEWSNSFFSLRVKTSASLAATQIELWAFAGGF